jgi:hypothetical protein
MLFVIANSSHACYKPPTIRLSFIVCHMSEKDKQLLKSWDQGKMIRAVADIRKGKWGLRRFKNYFIFPRYFLEGIPT